LVKKRTQPRSKLVPFLLMALGLVMVIGAMAFALNLPSTPATPTASTSSNTGAMIPFSSVPRISLADAKAAHELGSAIFMDVRGEPWYSNGHIQGAVSVPENEVEAFLDQFSPQDWIITYCT
jgi:hypothetical protein